jgi:hypothetical protein
MGFLYDVSPQRELLSWEAISQVFTAYLAEHPECDPAAVVEELTLISMGATTKAERRAAALRARLGEVWGGMMSDVRAAKAEIFSTLGKESADD